MCLPCQNHLASKEGFPCQNRSLPRRALFQSKWRLRSPIFWCACGKSAKQPFCDGSHKGTDFTPVKFEATESKTVYFCGCKHSANKPFCDGSHAKL
ncbi:conserved hypothetical protein [Candidatus Sulfotelmatobacter kueseliae]|uniref:Iron-binding zinc finger CDGSH type domain-containing protein n=1 Tax=Candidatus Sulfotelmatobacter kueseliae TaxID=2042962 RepID=A0A2U3LEJ5_9BACT|nr:conserved hypothetical protein [Candidatus Sulfotelmatobacter kueseliae]